jgi:hypothetical protein
LFGVELIYGREYATLTHTAYAALT